MQRRCSLRWQENSGMLLCLRPSHPLFCVRERDREGGGCAASREPASPLPTGAGWVQDVRVPLSVSMNVEDKRVCECVCRSCGG